MFVDAELAIGQPQAVIPAVAWRRGALQYTRVSLGVGRAAQPHRPWQPLEITQAEVQTPAALVAPAHQRQRRSTAGEQQYQLADLQLSAFIDVAQQARPPGAGVEKLCLGALRKLVQQLGMNGRQADHQAALAIELGTFVTTLLASLP